MAHFAELDPDDVVLRVLVVPDEQEQRGEEFLRDDLGLGGRWVQTSYTGSIRKNYAGPGYKYDRGRDAFLQPQPYASWRLKEETCVWEPPVPYPQAAGTWVWNEDRPGWQNIDKEKP